MKTSLTLFALTAFAVAAGAQSTTAQGAASAAGSAQSSVSNAGASASGIASAAENASAAGPAGQMSASAAQATQVSAVLSKSIDSKNAKVGDEVLAKTTSEARLANGTKIPRGSRLVGHVTEVEPRSHENRDGHVAFCFDHALLRNGQEIPVHVLMRSIAAPAALSGSASSSDDMMADGGVMGGVSGVGPGVRGGGGVVGGVAGSAGGALSAAPSMAGSAATGLAANTATAVNVAGNTTANTASLAPAGVGLSSATGSYAAFSGPVGNLSGVTFATVNASGDSSGSGVSGSANSSTATMLTAHGHNVALDSGSQMTMAVAAQQ